MFTLWIIESGFLRYNRLYIFPSLKVLRENIWISFIENTRKKPLEWI